MKKLVTALLLLTLLAPAFAENFFEVEWSEFCPKRYANINADKFYLTADARYWADRKAAFDKRLERCQNIDKNLQDACYTNLREIETQASRLYYEQSQAKALYNQFLFNK